MQFHEMKDVDLKLSLLSGDVIYVGNLDIHPYTLREIKEYGYTKYISNLQWISLTVDDFIDSIEDADKRRFLREQEFTLKPFDFYFKLGGEKMRNALINALSMIFKTDDLRVVNENGAIALGPNSLDLIFKDEDGNEYVDEDRLDSLSEKDIKIIHRDNFDDIVAVVKLQNYLEKPEDIGEEDMNPADEKTRKLMEHMKKMREKVESRKRQQQGDSEDDIDMSDIVSAVSSKSNSINKLNIWDFTLYQIYDEYARLELIDNYDISIKAMMAGAEKIELRHWSSRL